MATQSIFHNIIIQDSQTATSFIHALENSATITTKFPSSHFSSRDLTEEDIKYYFGDTPND